VAQYTSERLLEDIRTGAMLPASSSSLLTDADLLRLADREIQVGIVPLVLGVRSEYFVCHEDFPFTVGTDGTFSIRIPSRAIGGKLRDMSILVTGRTPRRIPQFSIDSLDDASGGFYVEGNRAILFDPFRNWTGNSARVSYYRRPNRLVMSNSSTVGVVAGFTSSTRQIVLVSSAPALFTLSSPLDIVRARPGYDCLSVDLIASSIVGNAIVMASDLPTELEVGDYVCLAEESPVPQIPSELHPALVQRVIVKALEAIGDMQGMQAAQAKMVEIQTEAIKLISPRVDGEPKVVRNLSSPFRRNQRCYPVY
jgi:hypothetical protein